MTKETLKQVIELNSKLDGHQLSIECIEQFYNSVPDADMDIDPWDDIDIVVSGPNSSLVLDRIPNQLKTDILELVKEYHSKQINNINEQIQKL